MIELPADFVGVGLGYFARLLRLRLPERPVELVWFDFGLVDPDSPTVADLLASWADFRAEMRQQFGVTIGDYRLDDDISGHRAERVALDEAAADSAGQMVDEVGGDDAAEQGVADDDREPVATMQPESDQAEQERIAAMLADPAAANRQAERDRRRADAAAGRATDEQMQLIYELSERAGVARVVATEYIVTAWRLRRIEDLTQQAAEQILRRLRTRVGGA
jgi:predicted nucleic acid-binding protein